MIARIDVGKVPHQVVVAQRLGKVVASNTADDTITIIDLKTLKPEATLALEHEPEHMALSPTGVILAVGNIGAGTVSLVSLETNREMSRVTGLFEPHNLTFDKTGALLYVANLGGRSRQRNRRRPRHRDQRDPNRRTDAVGQRRAIGRPLSGHHQRHGNDRRPPWVRRPRRIERPPW